MASMRILRAHIDLPLLTLWFALLAAYWAFFAMLPLEQPSLFYDWRVFFASPDTVPAYYPPWTRFLVQALNLPLLLALTLSTYSVAVLQKARGVASAVCAFLALPLVWTLYLGQLDGLALLGVLGLPYLAPLALIKPHVAAFALLARRTWWIVAAAVVRVTLAVWGLWPVDLFTCHAGDPAGLWPQDIALNLWGMPIFLLVVWRMPRDDPDWWMVAGATITPRLFPYNLLPLMPALARLRWPWALAAALASWLPLAANWLGPWAWHLGWVSVALLGIGLWKDKGRTTKDDGEGRSV